MLKHVLIAVDGSTPSRHAARFGLALAKQAKAKATVLFVLEMPKAISIAPLDSFLVTQSPRSEEEIERAHEVLDEIRKEYPKVESESRVELGSPADMICQVAEKLAVDLVVVGARGLGAGTRWLMGSVSDRVVHHAPCPVTVVR